MYLTHSNINYSEKLQLITGIDYPQYIHMITDGGMSVRKGLLTMPEALVRLTLKDSDTPKVIKELTNIPELEIGFILATGGCAWTGYSSKIKHSKDYPVHKLLPLGMTHIFAGKLANSLGKFDYISTDSSSCTSGHSAWHTAQLLINSGTLDAVVVVAVDNATSEESLQMFAEQDLCKIASEEDDPSIVKFHIGQGVHIGVLESERSLLFSKNKPLAHIEKVAITCESNNNPVGILSSGDGYRKAISKVADGDYDFIKPHGTYSKVNQIEEEVIKDMYGDIPLHRYKLRTGHTMGASTALETALAIKEHSGRFISIGAGMGNTFSAASVEILQ